MRRSSPAETDARSPSQPDDPEKHEGPATDHKVGAGPSTLFLVAVAVAVAVVTSRFIFLLVDHKNLSGQQHARN